jgi:hypothetical protein
VSDNDPLARESVGTDRDVAACDGADPGALPFVPLELLARFDPDLATARQGAS